ncbi:precorrin-2 dehydrogenase/sirohydrochlorin ferrochelatase family protein [Halomarina litorea]|uniref:precorrin-2 dehydrogenase/sirohydrochlorin ferrochelatase family protein n=1 Tax=Halomarina litorea TaxID=2961595 RepID=UPI0020C4C552|nr:bifunctional precorrin-2 dehydrogenase/sirohydrochlorin ferrochelatase [Halomarina sp. BCD28]
MIPLLHDLRGERVLVFGGGPVGARRARTFAEEAAVVVVSPAFADRSFGDASLVRARPAPEDVAGWVGRVAPALVVAATDDEAVNDAAASAARERGLPYNRADRSGGRDHRNVAVPSIVRDGDVVVGLSTGSPALTRELRKRVEGEVEGAGELASLTARLREDLREEYGPEERREALRAVVSSERVWKALGSGDAKAKQIVVEIVSAQLGDSPW